MLGILRLEVVLNKYSEYNACVSICIDSDNIIGEADAIISNDAHYVSE